MKKTVYLHIGAHKTGTSAIQHFLSANRKILKEDGYLYPGHGLAHHDMAQLFIKLTAPDIRNNPGLAISKHFEEINASSVDTIILSSEKFEFFKQQIPLLKEFLVPKFHVKIIYYTRRHDDLIESVYNQKMKDSRKQFIKTFTEFLSDFKGWDYYSLLLPWEEAFGKDNILVRCYEEEQLPKGIYHSFLDTIGLTLDDRYWIPENLINQSLSWDLIEVIRICNTSFRDDKKFHQFLLENLTLINSEFKEKKQHLFSPQQRRDIISLFEESNTKVAREYLGRSDGRLFYAPLPDLDEPWKPFDGLSVEKIVPLFTKIMYNIDKKREKSNKNLVTKKGQKNMQDYLGDIKNRLLSIFIRG